MKNSIKYIVIILILIISVGFITMSYLKAHYNETGEIKVTKKYYDIIFTNIMVDNDISVKVNNDEDSIHVEIPSFKNSEASISIDVNNIGNIDAIVDNFSYTNIVTNMVKDNMLIDVSLQKDSVIKGSESKRLNIILKYIGNDQIENPYYNFNINYIFKEVSI